MQVIQSEGHAPSDPLYIQGTFIYLHEFVHIVGSIVQTTNVQIEGGLTRWKKWMLNDGGRGYPRAATAS